MIKSGQAYHAAITGDARRVLLRAVIDIISPDIVFQAGGTSGQIPWSNLEQIHVTEHCEHCSQTQPNPHFCKSYEEK